MKGQYYLPVLLGLLISIGSSAAWADCRVLPPDWDVELTQEVRNKFAQDLLDRINEVVRVIPELSPTEKEWLNKELNSGDLIRWAKAGDSTENKYFITKDLLSSTSGTLSWLTVPNVYKHSLKQQVTSWAALVYTLMDIGGWEELGALHVRGNIKIPGVVKNMHQMDPASQCILSAKRIQIGIILPYLQGDLK